MEADHKTEKRKSLSDLASETFMLILQLRASTDYGNPGDLKSRVGSMFERFESNARRNGIDNEKVRLAVFALVAFLDETIISSDWAEKDKWLEEPMQIKLFDTFNAGEEFFTHMSNLRQKTSINKDILEIYYLCLSLGFKGKYQLQSPENIRRIVDDLNLELHPEAYHSMESLSPNGKPKGSIVQTVKTGLPLWVYPLGALAILVIIYVILSFSISGKAGDVLDYLGTLL